MKQKICTECNNPKPIYKNVRDEEGVYHRYCAQCYFASNKKEIKKISEKQKVRNKEYSIKRIKHLLANPMCEAAFPNCTKFSTQIHHKEYRGINTTNEESFLSVCASCHVFIHSNPIIARELNLLI